LLFWLVFIFQLTIYRAFLEKAWVFPYPVCPLKASAASMPW